MKHSRVLLADSHLGMLGGVHGLLDALFETVLMVADERSLMEVTATFKPDLVVVDLSLPNSGEVNIARRLMSQHPDLRLIVLSDCPISGVTPLPGNKTRHQRRWDTSD